MRSAVLVKAAIAALRPLRSKSVSRYLIDCSPLLWRTEGSYSRCSIHVTSNGEAVMARCHGLITLTRYEPQRDIFHAEDGPAHLCYVICTTDLISCKIARLRDTIKSDRGG